MRIIVIVDMILISILVPRGGAAGTDSARGVSLAISIHMLRVGTTNYGPAENDDRRTISIHTPRAEHDLGKHR